MTSALVKPMEIKALGKLSSRKVSFWQRFPLYLRTHRLNHCTAEDSEIAQKIILHFSLEYCNNVFPVEIYTSHTIEWL